MTGLPAVERDNVGERPEVSAPAFTGRDRELAALTRTLVAGPAVVLIEGEAGIGKTRLVREFLASPAGQGQRALVAGCPPFDQPDTLGPVADALRRASGDMRGLRLSPLAGALRPLFPEYAAALPAALEQAEDATAARHRLFRALEELLGCLQVGMLVAEDVHWADEATLEFLLFLASRRPLQVSLLLTCRPEDVPAGLLLPRLSRLAAGTSGLRHTLGPLNVAQTADLVSSMLGGQRISDPFAAFVHERTGGVPLALEESVRLMADRADLAHWNGKWIRLPLDEIAVPPTVRDAVLERVGRLTPDAQTVLRAAAVLADPTAEAVLTNVTGLSTDRARAGLCGALGSGLLAEDRGLVSFRHALAGRAVYEAILAPDRRVIHLRAGWALESQTPQPVARLARHFREAGETASWLHFGEQAADLAIASGHEMTAVHLICDLIANADLPTRDIARIMRKIPSLVWLDEAAQGKHLISALRDALGRRPLEPEEEAEIRVQLGRALLAANEYEAAGVELERAIPHLAHDPGEAARAMILLGYPDGSSWPAAKHLEWLDRAAKLPPPGRPAERLAVTGRRITALLRLGEQAGWAEAAQIPAEAATREEGLELARAHLNLGDLAMRWGRYAASRSRLTRALKLAESHDYRLLRDVFIVVTQIHLDWFTGAWEVLGDRARAASEADGMPAEARLEALLVAALLQAARDPAVHADQSLAFVLGEATRLGVVDESFGAAAALARLRLAAGRPDEALELTDLPMNIVTGKGIWVWAADIAPVRVEALLAAGRVGSAQQLVTAFGQGLRGRDAPAARGALRLCRALVVDAEGRQDDAAGLFAATAAAWARLPRPYDALLARERQGICLLAAGETEAGVSLLTEVLGGLSGLGATADADRVARCLRQRGCGVPRVWLGGRRGYGDRLSPRELDVVRLVAAGHTTREIARQLYRSPDTVYTQLRSAMRKLGVSSRAALVARAAEGEPDANTQLPEQRRNRLAPRSR